MSTLALLLLDLLICCQLAAVSALYWPGGGAPQGADGAVQPRLALPFWGVVTALMLLAANVTQVGTLPARRVRRGVY